MPAQILFTAAVVAIAFVAWSVLLRIVTAGDPVDIGAMLPHSWEAPWPRGVQEEEPFHWHLDMLDAHAEPATLPRRAAPVRLTEERAA